MARAVLPGRLVCAILLFILLGAAPLVSAQAGPNHLVHADAAPCLQRMGLTATPTSTTTCVVAYAHFQDWHQQFLNLERPPDGLPAVEAGSSMPTVSGYWELNKFRFQLEAGPIEYDQEGDLNMLHERGPAKSLDLHDSLPIHLRLHLTVDQAESTLVEGPPIHAGYDPCITVEARLVAHVRLDNERIERVLSETKAPGVLARPNIGFLQSLCGTSNAYHIDPEGITTFDLQLPPADHDVAPGGMHVEVSVYGTEADGTRVGLPGVRLYQDATHLNHVVFPVHDTLTIEGIRGAWAEDGRFYLRANISSPWGGYDVHPGSIRAEIVDDQGRVVVASTSPLLEEPIVLLAYCAHCSADPVRVTIPFDLRGADLPDGAYRFRIQSDNSQETARVAGESLFVVGDQGTRLTVFDAQDQPLESRTLKTNGDGRAATAEIATLVTFLFAALAAVALAWAPRRR